MIDDMDYEIFAVELKDYSFDYSCNYPEISLLIPSWFNINEDCSDD